MTSIPKISVQKTAEIKANQNTALLKTGVIKNDSFEKTKEPFNIDVAMQTLADIKKRGDIPKFSEDNLKQIRETLEKTPEKWNSINKLSTTSLTGQTVVDLTNLETANLNVLTDITTSKDFLAFQITDLSKLPLENLNNAKLLSKTGVDAYCICKIAKENLKNTENLVAKINDLEKSLGNNFKSINVVKNPYDKTSYMLTAQTKDKKEITEVMDKNFNRRSLEEKYEYTGTSGKKYIIKKTNDFRNNTTSKTRLEKTGKELPTVTNEIRIIKDKNGKIQKTEYTELSEVTGVYNIKELYPNGKINVISSGKVDPKTGITTVKKNMVSSDGTKTEFLYEDDPKGNRISDYKITDRNGKVLLNNSTSFEVISENKFISSKNNEKYEITLDKDILNVKDLNNPKKPDTKIDINKFVKGNKALVIDTLKSMPGQELIKMNQSVAKIDTYGTPISSFDPRNKTLNTNEGLFVVLHELGHATDIRDINTTEELGKSKLKGIFEDKELNEIYEQEKENFNKKYPNAQKDNIGYFINHETHSNKTSGGLMETIAESNALLSTPKTSDMLAIRAQYLQQHFPRTIAKLDKLLNTYNEVTETTIAQKPILDANNDVNFGH